jgi:phospholipid-translocating ATPase
MRHPEDILERFREFKFFGKLDLRSSYHQLALTEDSYEYTAFATPQGLFEFTRVPFGIQTAPQFFSMSLSSILRPIPNQDSFIDDIFFGGVTEDDYISTLHDILSVLRAYGLRLKPTKCLFGASELNFLGHVVNNTTIAPCPTRKHGIAKLRPPATRDQLKSFLGLANYLRKFVSNFASLASPFYKLTSPSTRFVWTSEHQQAFEKLKFHLVNAAPLYHLDPSCPLILRTDASMVGLGAMLLQLKNGEEQPLYYISRSFSERERRWSTIEQEAYAIYYAIRALSVYLSGRQFMVETDHRNLVYLQKATASKLVRWRLFLQDFNFEIKHIEGKSNVVADALSRCCAVQADILQSFHGALTGHCGIKELRRRLKEANITWDTIDQDVTDFVSNCVVCQKIRTGQMLLPAGRTSIKVTHPFEELSIDTMGPLPADSDGNKYILCVQDSFSKYLELIPTKDATAITAAKGLLQVFSRYGAPSKLRSDQGLQFTASVISELLKIFSVQPTIVAAYNPEANGIVERAHRETLKHLRALIMSVKSKATWSSFLPFVQRIQNDTFCRAIGTTPTSLLFAGAVKPLALITDRTSGHIRSTTAADYISELQHSYTEILESAQTTFAKYVYSNELKHPDHIRRFEPGHLVFVNNAHVADKLDPVWSGPFAIVQQQSDGIYLVQDLRTNAVKQIAANRLKRAFLSTADPLTVAAEDSQEYPVESIVDHEEHKILSRWNFLVRWQGCGPADDVWLPYSNVRELKALDDYLDAHPNVKLPHKGGKCRG